MDEGLQKETERLTRSWMRHEAQMLSSYLVAGVEDPRINIQSILTRHLLIVALFGNRFEKLLAEELRFALVMNWLRSVFEQAAGSEDLEAIRHALVKGADDAEGLAIPGFVAKAFRELPAAMEGAVIPDYLVQALDQRLGA
jgi:hypothetical protein